MAKNTEEQSHIEERPKGNFLIVGIDPSMNSTALTIHTCDMVGCVFQSDYVFVPSTKGQMTEFRKGLPEGQNYRQYAKSSIHCAVEALDIDDSQENRIKRFRTMATLLYNHIKRVATDYCVTNIYVSIEDYAMRAMGRVYPIGEYGGILRMALLTLPAPTIIRESDPLTIKLYATKGNADKFEMYDAYVADNSVGHTFDPEFFVKQWEAKVAKGKGKTKPLGQESPLADLIDSWWIAEVLSTELWLRWGWLPLANLRPSRLQVVNRVTKTYPVNLLNRPFLR